MPSTTTQQPLFQPVHLGEPAAFRAANIRDLLDMGLTVDDIREPLDMGCLDQPQATLRQAVGS